MSDLVVRRLSPAACRSYLVSCGRTKRALVIDPLAGQGAAVEEFLDREGLKLDWVVDTHTHADHVSDGAALAARAGVPYALHGSTGCGTATERLNDGQKLSVGDQVVEVIHTPGHTGDSISLRVGQNLFTGDFLFLAQDGAGRLDLPGGDPGAHWDSLQRLASLGDDMIVLPGHDYNDLDSSTLGEERVQNPRFQRVTREEYVTWQRAIAMPTPQWMLDVIAANLGRTPHADGHLSPEATACATVDGETVDGQGDGGESTGGGACQASAAGRVPMLTVEEAARRRASASPPFLLDVREPHEFSGPVGRHASGATLLPLGHLPHRISELTKYRDSEVLVICKSGGRSARAVEFLIASGFRRVFNVAGGTDQWVRAGLPHER